MTEAVTVTAEARQERGKRRARRLRQAGRVPAVVYGHKQDTIPLTVDRDAMWDVVRHGTRVVDLQLNGQSEKCLVKEIQWDTFGKEIIHVDFTRVSADERVRLSVPIQLRGQAPGVSGGGILEQPLHEIEIECLALEIPEAIRVNIHELQVDQAILVKDLKLPAGVTTDMEPEAIVVQIVKPQEEVEEEALAAEGPAEPEVISRKAEETESAEE